MHSKKFKCAIIICAITFVTVLFLFSPFFYLDEIIISGNSTVAQEEIRDRLGADRTTNILFFNQNAARRRIIENLYVSNVIFTRSLPGRLYVEVLERRLAAYVEQSPGTFLFLDDQGRVLEVRSSITQPLPIIEGLNFTHFALGEVLEVPDLAAFNIMTHYAHLVYRHGLVCRVTHINVSDTSNTRILFSYVEFNVGCLQDAEAKVRIIAGMLEEIPEVETIRGFVDLRDISGERGEFFFTILT